MQMQGHVQDINEIIDNERFSSFQIRTIILCGCVAVLDGFDTQVMGFLVPAISRSFGLHVELFASVFSAGLIGVMIGAMLLGPIADKIGRRIILITATLIFGLFTLAAADAHSLETLIGFRFLAGLGLGAAMPNAVAYATEFSPLRYQAKIVSWLFAGIPVGALLAGGLSYWLIPLIGWRGIFEIGGILPILLTIILAALVPESVRFLLLKQAPVGQVLAIMRRIAPGVAFQTDQRFISTHTLAKGVPVKYLFTQGRATGTLLLWVPYLMNLIVIYLVMSWLPALLHEGGLSLSVGISAATAFSLGGAAGCLVTGQILRAFGSHRVVFVEFLAAIALVTLLAFFYSRGLLPIIIITTVLGFVVQGAQAGLNALVAEFYPTSIRSTGVGWALGIGRVGAIIGPIIGGIMLSFDMPISRTFLMCSVPAVIAAIAIFTMMKRVRSGIAKPQDDAPIIMN